MDKAAIWIMVLEGLRIKVQCDIASCIRLNIEPAQQRIVLESIEDMLMFLQMSYDAYMNWLGVDTHHYQEAARAPFIAMEKRLAEMLLPAGVQL
jgi:hypothetical protein